MLTSDAFFCLLSTKMRVRIFKGKKNSKICWLTSSFSVTYFVSLRLTFNLGPNFEDNECCEGPNSAKYYNGSLRKSNKCPIPDKAPNIQFSIHVLLDLLSRIYCSATMTLSFKNMYMEKPQLQNAAFTDTKGKSKYSRTSMAPTFLGPRTFVLDMGSSSHWGSIIEPG